MTRVAVVGVGCGSEAGVEESVLIYAGWMNEWMMSSTRCDAVPLSEMNAMSVCVQIAAQLAFSDPD
jgi:hypothetical protein